MFGKKKDRQMVSREFYVAGTNYHQDDLMRLSFRNVTRPPEEGYERIYLYHFLESPVELVPDPKNEHDPNAIKVLVNKQWIGFVPAVQCLEIKEILKHNDIKFISCHIAGGPSVKWEDMKMVSSDAKNITARVVIGYVD